MRKHSNSSLSVDLNLDCLERFLRRTVRHYSEDRELAATAEAQFAGIAEHCRSRGLEHCKDDLSNVASVLDTFVSSSPSLPAAIVYEVHSLMGLVRVALKQHSVAVKSYMKALWFASATEDIPQEQLAVTLHRLGKAYGDTTIGRYGEASYLLTKALDIYERAHVHKDHHCVVDARQTLESVQEKFKKSKKREARSSLRSFGRLSFIQEEPERRLSM